MANAINGLSCSSDGGNTLAIGSGTADDSTNNTTITIPSGETRTIDVTTSGPGGLDTGTIAPNTMYAVYVLKNSNNGNVSGILSLKFSGFTWNNASWRRVGSVLTNNLSKVVAFTQSGSGASRQVVYNATPAVLTLLSGASASNWTDFSLAPPKPPTSVSSTAKLSVTPSGGTTHLREGPGGPEHSFPSPGEVNFAPPTTSNHGNFRTASGASTTVMALGYSESV